MSAAATFCITKPLVILKGPSVYHNPRLLSTLILRDDLGNEGVLVAFNMNSRRDNEDHIYDVPMLVNPETGISLNQLIQLGNKNETIKRIVVTTLSNKKNPLIGTYTPDEWALAKKLFVGVPHTAQEIELEVPL